MQKETAHEGWKLLLAEEGDTPLGFIYGYATRPGQWWHDTVTPALPPRSCGPLVHERLRQRRVRSKHLSSEQILGTRLHAALLEDLPHSAAVAMTHQDDNPAVGFYLNRGWRTITLNVCDAARSASFHQDLFGCQVERQDGDLIWLSTNADEKSSVLLLLHAWPNPVPTTYGISFEFEVPSVDGAVQAAQALGAEVTRDPIRMDYGKREATILDPDGYPIWLVQPLH